MKRRPTRGILMLFAIKDRKRWIEVGYGLEGILNDAKVGDIGRDMVPALRDANYDEAASNGLRQITRIIANDAGVTLDALANSGDQNSASAPVTGPPPSSESPSAARWLFLLPFLFPILIFSFLIWRIATAVRRGTANRGNSGFAGGSSFDSSDSFGSSSSSSSDDSFSGGDGGSSGGGGAGGDW